jgi:beta-glucosidase-like glycosyl hydrolase
MLSFAKPPLPTSLLYLSHAGYSLEDADGFTRHNFDANITARDLTETYFPAFAMCLSAEPEQIMCSYNSVNGIPTCLDGKAQNGLLRDQLGFEGLIVSDCDAIGDAYDSHHYSKSAADAAAEGIKAGCDQVRISPPPPIRFCGPNVYRTQSMSYRRKKGMPTSSGISLCFAC